MAKKKNDISKTLTNYGTKEVEDDEGEKTTVSYPLSVKETVQKVRRVTSNSLNRTGSMLFAHKQGTDDDVHFITKSTELPAYASGISGNNSRFLKGVGYLTPTEIYHECCRTLTDYPAIEKLPHEPKIPGHYYACKFPKPGKGEAMRLLLARFNPATDIDADLIQAAIATLFWGGKSGQRPAFLITSDDGRGAGKTRLVSMLSHLAGGLIELSANEDIQVLKQRLLSPEGMMLRMALLDNAKTLKFSWAEFEALITTDFISGKRMYVGEARRPNNLTYFITLNGASLSTDIAQRCCIIKLAKPIYSGDWEDDTRALIDEHREAIIGDALGFLQSHAEPLERCSRWGAWERDIVARLSEPTEAQAVIRERQQVADVDKEESEIIEDHFKAKLIDCDYNVDTEKVFLPSKVVNQWFSEATSEKFSAVKVSKMLKQKIQEGGINCIQENHSRSYGRGFLWVGLNWDCETPTQPDLEHRIEIKNRQKFMG
ncbi:hypothetical protein [uncultured Gimesia sp.]|uniref:hypothetical protein n=1 Tax=uncultured Gimesia sp. TaxID=1678688 RepID=UPI0026219569|nr:hypothetical protein [uncultured Gimesia sp.]